jgi:aspartate carbamoyltransferase
MQYINGAFKNKHILSLDQFTKKDIEILFTHVPSMKKLAVNAKPSSILSGSLVTMLFFEPSSRTFSSFSASVKQLGGQTITIHDPVNISSFSKGETLEDAIQVFEAYCDAIVLRHSVAGMAQKAAIAAQSVPIINAGDGIGEHPTQALLDLYTIYEAHKKLDNLTGVMVGDLLNGRTVHSLLRGLSLYKGNTIYLLSPNSLQLSKKDVDMFTKNGLRLITIKNIEELPKNAHFWYWTRVQKERFKSISECERVKNKFILSNKIIAKYAGKSTLFMHPLPRVGEILTEVDNDPRAVYLTSQIRNGMYVRMALLGLVMGKLK